ncbi:Serine protease inhibitor, Kazal-type family protein [Quillaja saponaria]|uniref:Serine protease inhibitor, Kazal-type family protein n=1 Tax=Quillaja saponaria TaxID=32244 RepID=A0AAD7LW48_QUISA|nr:Serine protease inhibitor, Kazal-type family protein [Quillaja saponaria]
MAQFSQTPYFPYCLAFMIIISTLCPTLIVRAEYQSSPTIRLPSEATSDDQGICGRTTPSSCPVNCFRTDPVCGVDGVTYWCGCADALCAGTRVAKLGFCEVGSGGSTPLSGQALLLVHILWLIVLGFSVLFGLF